MLNNSTPSFTEFDPKVIPYQYKVLEDLECHFDYSIGTHECLLSGSVGSAKSILMAHLAVKHCLKWPRARVFVGRRSLADLRRTIWRKLIDHLDGCLKQGVDYKVNLSRLEIRFCNGSEIMCGSWADGQYMKLRSLELSSVIIEELTENDEDDKQAYDEIKMRVGRLPHVLENWIVSATNPDTPDHWAYKYFIEGERRFSTRHVYYSVTTDNPFLPPQYIEQLKNDLDPKMARRMIYGEWLEIQGEVVYYAYDKDRQFIPKTYVVNRQFPVILTWDFNIGQGKPMSMACLQYIDDTFHVFNEVVIHGARTADTIDELEFKGLLNPEWTYHVSGDAAGKHRDTRGSRTDYDIILKELQNRNLKLVFRVPLANPAVRSRHNYVNAYCQNAKGRVRLFVYKEAPTADEGFRLTKLKKNAGYLEDDSKSYQHIGTAIGYAICFEATSAQRKPQGTVIT